MSCGKDTLVVNKRQNEKTFKNKKVFRFAQFDIVVLGELYGKISEMALLFVFPKISACKMPDTMVMHKGKIGRKQ